MNPNLVKHRGLAILVLGLAPSVLFWSCAKPAEEKPAASDTTAAAAAPAEVEWGYHEAATGPAAWGSLSPKFVACAEGLAQSPIDIVETKASGEAPIATNYQPAELRLVHHLQQSDEVNTGHSIQVNFPNGDTLRVGGVPYALAQFHFHSPSEHTVKGRQFPMEMHLVHKAADGSLAVLGVLIEEGAHNAAFEGIWSNLPATKGVEAHLPEVAVDLEKMLPKDRHAFRYAGSLTTPPCSEGVRWSVFSTPIQLSPEQVATFRKVLHGNNRPVQPLNGREVTADLVR